MMIIVKNVINRATQEVGDLKLKAYRYTPESRELRKNDNRGLVVFFNDRYIKSFILTKVEFDNITKNNANMVNDLGYLLNISLRVLEIIDIAAYHTIFEQKGDFEVGKVGFSRFYLEDVTVNHYNSYIDSYGYWGFQLAVITALNNYSESTDLVSRELHSPSHVFDFKKLPIHLTA